MILTKRKTIIFRAFDKLYNPVEKRYVAFIDKLVHHSGFACLLGMLLVIVAIFGLSRIPTGFIPLEDQGYAILNVVLPDGATLGRTEAVMEELSTKVLKACGD